MMLLSCTKIWAMFSIVLQLLIQKSCKAWTTQSLQLNRAPVLRSTSLHVSFAGGATEVHGENACFLPLQQLNQDYYAPRIVAIAGAYPGLTKLDLQSVQSTPMSTPGQWTYEFPDPTHGTQLGTIALDGSKVVAECDDPVAIISDHFTLGLNLPATIKDPVDLLVLVNRANTQFEERKFLVMQLPGKMELFIGAYQSKSDIPTGGEILGRVDMVQIPWLPAMKPTRSGFQEENELYSG